jgi:hypothetical protein
VAWGIQSGGVSTSIGFNISLYLESRATPAISASLINKSECVSVCLYVRD